MLLDSLCVWRESDAQGNDIYCGTLNPPKRDVPAGTVTGYVDMATLPDMAQPTAPQGWSVTYTLRVQ